MCLSVRGMLSQVYTFFLDEESQEAVSDLADILKLERKYEQVRKEQEKSEETTQEPEVRGCQCVCAPKPVVYKSTCL